MNWNDFLNGLKPKNEHQESVLLEKLKNFPSSPDIFWYPGSGKDMVPLLLDVPNNPTHRRLYRINQSPKEKPFLYWMNDYCENLNDFPEDHLLGQKLVPEYNDLWEENASTVVIGKNKEQYRFDNNITITLFTACVKNQIEGKHSRGETGDEYLICFSSCESERLLKKVFAPYHFHLSIIALIRQGAFSGQRSNFHSYTNLPDSVVKLEEKIGIVNFWAIDLYGQNDEKMPLAKSLSEYEYIGGPLKWGWPPARLYGRPGISYSRENRSERKGTSWRSG